MKGQDRAGGHEMFAAAKGRAVYSATTCRRQVIRFDDRLAEYGQSRQAAVDALPERPNHPEG